jgi:hypothetical protein
MDLTTHENEAISLYIDLKPNTRVDLEVAALAAVEWARSVKAAAMAIDRSYDYRVLLIAAEPGSSKWLAKIERSAANQFAKDVQAGWSEMPLILRLAVSLAVVIPTTAAPTYEYWLGDAKFTPAQIEQLHDALGAASADQNVETHRKAMYREIQKDPQVIGLGGGVPDKPDWKPQKLVPVSRFAEADGLFELMDDAADNERTLTKKLDVILVTPQLENAQRSWTFRQEGIPGKFNAEMKDSRFLSALDRSGISEKLRANIPMQILLEVKERLSNGEWKLKRRGRSVLQVISPAADPF